MSSVIDDKPISMWTNNEIFAELDRIVSSRQTDRNTAVIAEAVHRALSHSSSVEGVNR